MAEPIGGTLAIEVELRKEKVASLKRVGLKLEAALAELVRIEGELRTAKSTARRPLLEQHEQMRAEAEKFRWYLIIQREAIGVRSQTDVMNEYPIPARLR